jgi:hypothetical protein
VARGESVQAAGMRRDVFLGARFAFLFVRAFVRLGPAWVICGGRIISAGCGLWVDGIGRQAHLRSTPEGHTNTPRM